MVQDNLRPFSGSTGAADSTWFREETWYDTVAEASDGSTIMYGYIAGGASADVVQLSDMQRVLFYGLNSEDDRMWSVNTRLGLIWFALPGLKQGMRIEEAYINFTNKAATNVQDGEWAYVRLDTVIADYVIRDFDSADTGDAGRFEVTFDDLIKTGGTEWVPPLQPAAAADYWGRGDFHDFGPRSEKFLIGPLIEQATGTAIRIDVTEPLQQHVDNGDAAEGALFIIYGTNNGSTVDVKINCGSITSIANSLGGNPALHVVATSRRGGRPWDGQRVPFAMTFDDLRPIHADYMATTAPRGLDVSLSANRNNFLGQAWVDSIYSLHPGNFYIMNHGYNENLLGENTGATLNGMIEKDWIPTLFTTVPDTTNMDYVWAGGIGTVFSFEALSKLVSYGYRSARGTSQFYYSTCPIGDTSYIAWDWPVNIYATNSISTNLIFEDDGALAEWAYIKENMMDLADIYYSDRGKSALLLYGHNLAADHVSPANYEVALAVADSLNCVTATDYGAVISMRMSAFMDPADITETNGYTAAEELTAARYDSLRTANSDDNMLEVWLEPK